MQVSNQQPPRIEKKDNICVQTVVISTVAVVAFGCIGLGLLSLLAKLQPNHVIGFNSLTRVPMAVDITFIAVGSITGIGVAARLIKGNPPKKDIHLTPNSSKQLQVTTYEPALKNMSKDPWKLVFSKLDIETLIRIRRVCKEFLYLIDTTDWKFLRDAEGIDSTSSLIECAKIIHFKRKVKKGGFAITDSKDVNHIRKETLSGNKAWVTNLNHTNGILFPETSFDESVEILEKQYAKIKPSVIYPNWYKDLFLLDKYLFTGRMHGFEVWELRKDQEAVKKLTFQPQNFIACTKIICEDGWLFAGGHHEGGIQDQKLYTFSFDKGKGTLKSKGQISGVESHNFVYHKGQLVTFERDGTLKIFTFEDKWKNTITLTDHLIPINMECRVTALFCKDDKLICGTEDGRISIWTQEGKDWKYKSTTTRGMPIRALFYSDQMLFLRTKLGLEVHSLILPNGRIEGMGTKVNNGSSVASIYFNNGTLVVGENNKIDIFS